MKAIAHLKDNNTGSILDAFPFDFNYFATTRKVVRDIKTHWGFNGIKSKSTEQVGSIHVTLHGLKCHIVIHLDKTETEYTP
jgi:hypothetical protein